MATFRLKSGAYVEDSGEGDETALCLHGLGGSSNTWLPVLSAFGDMRVIRLDLPGSARSPLPTSPLSIGLYVETVISLLDELRIRSAHVVAHSMGTVVAFHLATRAPARVTSLALFGPLLAPPDAGRAGIRARAALARERGVAGIQEIADTIVNGATSAETKSQRPSTLALVRESIMRQSVEGYAQSCEALAAAEPAAIDSVAVPTLLVTGQDDGVGSPAGVRAISERIVGSQVVLLPGCGHWTTFEKPVECAAVLRDFYTTRGTP